MEFAVLGEVRVSRAGQPIALGGPQQRRLLAVLLANTPRSVALERIIEVMWDDPPPDGARRTTMSYISRLRGALGPGRVDLVDAGYRLVVADSEFDANRFERLVEQSRVAPPTEAITLLDRALGLWQGPCFGDFSGSWWAIPMASRLEEMRLSAEEERIDVLLAIDRIEQATAQLELLTAAYPLRPGFTERLMRASAIAGREAEALRAMSTYRRHLAEETGLDPPAALIELERLICPRSIGITIWPHGRRCAAIDSVTVSVRVLTVWCIGRFSLAWDVAWPSRSSSRNSQTIPSSSTASSAKRSSSLGWNTLISCRSTTSGVSQEAPFWCFGS
jgi:DNA-binding SARP family transcriptional activator